VMGSLQGIGEEGLAAALRITGQGCAKPDASLALGDQGSMNQFGCLRSGYQRNSVVWGQGEGARQGPI
jgi:hypothetical protein